MEQIVALNQQLFLQINADVNASYWAINSARFVAQALIYFIPILLIGMWLWGEKKRRELALKIFFVMLIGIVISQIIGWCWPQSRPFALGLGHAWLAHAANASFPSNHALIFACFAFTLYCSGLFKSAGVAGLLGIAVAWSRIYLGVHFPLDILGGIGVAVLAYLLVDSVWSKLGNAITEYVLQSYRFLLALPIAKGWVKH